MGNLAVGDIIFDESGRVCRVTWVSSIEMANGYRFGFSDGSSLDSCSEHQWVTWTFAERKAFLRSPYEQTDQFPEDWPTWRLKRLDGAWRQRTPQKKVDEAREMVAAGLSTRLVAAKIGVSRSTLMALVQKGDREPAVPATHWDSPGPRIRVTQEIADTLVFGARGDNNHCIPQCGPLDLGEVELPVPPYTLGAWLGDGTRCEAMITQHQDDQPSLIRNIELDGFGHSTRSDPQSVGILGLHGPLHAAGVWKNKHVPSIYLRASVTQRLALLQGLMDTDGGVEAASSVSFTNGNKQIADSVYELVVSLGMKATREVRSAEVANLTDAFHWNQDSHRVTFTPTMQVFRLPRKADRLSFSCGQQLRRRHRMIISAESIGPVPMRCITVDSKHSMYLAGREMIPTHNTRVGAEDFARYGMKYPGRRMAVIASTYQSARDVCIEGESGLLANIPEQLVRDWNRSIGELTLVNNTNYRIFTGEKPSALRGPQHHRIWSDEIPHWKHPEETWDMAQMGLRLGDKPQNIITSTPLPIELIRNLRSDPNTHLTVGSTYDNRENLAETFFTKIIAKYEGTRLGLQELYANVLDDLPGSLWQKEMIDRSRITRELPDVVALRCKRIVVAIDPAITDPKRASSSKDDEDVLAETGIVVVGIDEDGHGYVLADGSCRESPRGWAQKAVDLYNRFKADKVIGERNQGGDMVEEVIRHIAPNIAYGSVTATRSKYVRAEPISLLYEQDRVSHVGLFPKLEEQMCLFTPEHVEAKSPDRADALVWGMTDIFDGCQNLGLLKWQREQKANPVVAGPINNIAVAAPEGCVICKSVCLAKVNGGYRCSQCGHQMGHSRLTAQVIGRSARATLRGARY